MPIYEYECECGARFESLESVGSTRSECGDQCCRAANRTAPPRGLGRVARLMSAAGIRGAGHDAKPAVFNPAARLARPGCDDCGDSAAASSEADVGT